jgi:hypothetical protein
MGTIVDLAVIDYCRQTGREVGSGQGCRQAERQINQKAGWQTGKPTDIQTDR